jgi:hypothetical protein
MALDTAFTIPVIQSRIYPIVNSWKVVKGGRARLTMAVWVAAYF